MKDIELLNNRLNETILKTESFFNSQKSSLCSCVNDSDSTETNKSQEASCENLSFKQKTRTRKRNSSNTSDGSLEWIPIETAKTNASINPEEEAYFLNQHKNPKTFSKKILDLNQIPFSTISIHPVLSNKLSERRKNLAYASRGVVFSMQSNRRLRVDPVHRYLQYQTAWKKDKFLCSHSKHSNV